MIIGTFAEDGPTRCSGLDVVRYSAQALHEEFGPGFDRIDSLREDHVTPAAAHQPFQYSLFQFR